MEKGLFYGFLVIGLLLVGATGVFFYWNGSWIR
jgi:hypothetical protein